ncbi:MAG: DNA-directed RNA polymerase subunit alpha C-terminal domain-containing protein [Desulfosporosinus sp.]|nr:DNA-directed RNA polymerase subunit alpha C-terminal domain-containing protein [Desulfosporosinus sp.]
MVIERQITVYECSFCQKTYSQKEDAERCETSCAKLSGSPDIEILKLTQRTFNCLKMAGIDTVQEVLEKTDSDLLRIKGFGDWCLRDLHKQLQPFGNQTEGLEEPSRNARPQRFINSDGTLDLTEFVETQITQFVDRQDWIRLYKGYHWRSDTWTKGERMDLKGHNKSGLSAILSLPIGGLGQIYNKFKPKAKGRRDSDSDRVRINS